VIDRFVFWLVGLTGAWFVRILGRTIRMNGLDRGIPAAVKARYGRVIYILSHGQLFLGAYLARSEPIVTLISQHRDGEYASRVTARLGIQSIRGSSTRGGAAALFRLLKSSHYRKHDIGITPDGPRGPLRSVKPGVILLARRLGCPVLPVAIHMSSCWEFSSWDRFQIPRPFSMASIRFGKPMLIGREADEDEIEQVRGELERELEELQAADNRKPVSGTTGRERWTRTALGDLASSAVHRYLSRREERWWFLPLSLALTPFEGVWMLASSIRNFLYQTGFMRVRQLPVPVISVGNLVIGGTGKTILVSTLARILSQLGYRIAILTRGYGGRCRDGIRVATVTPNARGDSLELGDEPVYLARTLPDCVVIRGRDRYLSGLYAATRYGCDLCILDDGFQHRRLHRDIDIVLVRGEAPFGNGRLLPAGPLREGPGGLKRADLLVRCWRWKEGKGNAEDGDRCIPRGIPLLEASLVVEKIFPLGEAGREMDMEEIQRKSILAFAGIGDPISFQRMIESWSPRSSEFIFFPDHHSYPIRSIDRLNRAFDRIGADLLLTTEKDAVKLDRERFEGRPCWVVSVAIKIESGREALDELLAMIPSAGRSGGSCRNGEGRPR